MPLWLILYEVGIRVTQALEVFPEDPSGDEISEAFSKQMLANLENALDRLYRAVTGNDLIQRCSRIMRDIHITLDSRTLESYCEVQIYLCTLRKILRERCQSNDGISAEDELWFRLGLEIANAYACNYSGCRDKTEYHPTDSPWGRKSEFVSQFGKTWEWRNGETLRQLKAEITQDLDVLFPNEITLTAQDWECIPALPNYLWGWVPIEVGLQTLLREPERINRHDSPTRRRRGRPPARANRTRDRLVRAAKRANPELTEKKLARFLEERYRKTKYRNKSTYRNLNFTRNNVHHALRASNQTSDTE